jgi:hypothetical protein
MESTKKGTDQNNIFRRKCFIPKKYVVFLGETGVWPHSFMGPRQTLMAMGDDDVLFR